MDVSDALIAEAFALADARGVALLAKLADYCVWHGDLSEMRGDSPRTTRSVPAPATSPRLLEVALMVQAIERLSPECRNAMVGREHSADAAACKQRLIELYAELQGREVVASDGTRG